MGSHFLGMTITVGHTVVEWLALLPHKTKDPVQMKAFLVFACSPVGFLPSSKKYATAATVGVCVRE